MEIEIEIESESDEVLQDNEEEHIYCQIGLRSRRSQFNYQNSKCASRFKKCMYTLDGRLRLGT